MGKGKESMSEWLAVVSSGSYSDTHVFVVGVYSSRSMALADAEELVEKSKDINRKAEEAARQEDFELEDALGKKHAELFGVDYFPPTDDWRISVTQLDGDPIRVF